MGSRQSLKLPMSLMDFLGAAPFQESVMGWETELRFAAWHGGQTAVRGERQAERAAEKKKKKQQRKQNIGRRPSRFFCSVSVGLCLRQACACPRRKHTVSGGGSSAANAAPIGRRKGLDF